MIELKSNLVSGRSLLSGFTNNLEMSSPLSEGRLFWGVVTFVTLYLNLDGMPRARIWHQRDFDQFAFCSNSAWPACCSELTNKLNSELA